MKKFKLCYESRDRPGHYIAPTFLPRDRPDPDESWDNVDNLKLRYFYPFKPKKLFQEFIVEVHSLIVDNRVWRHGVILQDPSSDVQIEAIEDPQYRETTIGLRVSGKGDKRRFLQIVAHRLQAIQNRYGDATRFKYTTQIPCNCSECAGSAEPHFFKWNVLERLYNKGITEDRCDVSLEMVDLIGLIDNISTWRSDRGRALRDTPNGNDGRSPITAPQPLQQNFYIQPQQTMSNTSGRTINTGGGDYRETNLSGNAQYAERDIVNHNNQAKTPAEAAQEIQDLLTQLKLTPDITNSRINTRIAKQDLEWQKRLWSALKNAAPEFLKSGAAIALTPLGFTGTAAAATLNVIVEATRGALEDEDVISPDEPDPIDMAKLMNL